MFFICKELGVAFEVSEAGERKFDSSSKEFENLFLSSELKKLHSSDWLLVSEDEARSFAEAKIAGSTAS